MKKLDLTGKRFGNLVAIREGEKRGKHITWVCKCDCGEEKEFYISRLTKGHSTSCGECEKFSYIGKRFGKLVVLGIAKRHRPIKFECQCDCGNKTVVSEYALKSGMTQSCGCLRRLDLVGQKFGELTVLRKAGKDKHRNSLWECQCSCGQITIARGFLLKCGEKKSCGCQNYIRDHSKKYNEKYVSNEPEKESVFS